MVDRSINAAPRFVRTWVQAVGPLSLTASAVPVSLGATVAATQGLFNPGWFLLTLAAAMAIQSAGALLSASVQRRRGGAVSESYDPGLAGIRSLLRDPLIFLLFGPLAVIGAYYVQAASFELVPMLYALPVGCLATALLRANSLRRAPCPSVRDEAERPSALGGGGVCGPIVAAYLLVIAGAASGTFVRWSALALISAPLAWTLVRQAMGAKASQDLASLDVAAGRVHLAFGLLLVLGVLLPAT